MGTGLIEVGCFAAGPLLVDGLVYDKFQLTVYLGTLIIGLCCLGAWLLKRAG